MRSKLGIKNKKFLENFIYSVFKIYSKFTIVFKDIYKKKTCLLKVGNDL